MAKTRSSLLDWFLIAIKKGKPVAKVKTFNVQDKTVETTTGDTVEVDYFLSRKSPSPFLELELQELGIDSTSDVQAYLQEKEDSEDNSQG